MKLNEYLNNRKLSIREFSNIVNRNRSTVSRWLSENPRISLEDSILVLENTEGKVLPTDFLIINKS